MRLFSRAHSRVEEAVAESGEAPETVGSGPDCAPHERIAGDRGTPSINRVRSVQSRVSSLLAITLMTTIGAGLLSWYYAKTLSRSSQAQHAAAAVVRSRAEGEMPLPGLGRIKAPVERSDPPTLTWVTTTAVRTAHSPWSGTARI